VDAEKGRRCIKQSNGTQACRGEKSTEKIGLVVVLPGRGRLPLRRRGAAATRAALGGVTPPPSVWRPAAVVATVAARLIVVPPGATVVVVVSSRAAITVVVVAAAVRCAAAATAVPRSVGTVVACATTATATVLGATAFALPPHVFAGRRVVRFLGDRVIDAHTTSV
jgi:hypothetical protein